MTETDVESWVMEYLRANGAAYFTELWLEIETPKRPLERALKDLTNDNRLVVYIEPGRYPNRVRYELPGNGAPMKPLPRDRYWEGDFGPPTRDAELNLEADLRKAAHRQQAHALRCLETESRNLPELLASRVEERALEDLANVGLAIGGVDLGRRERTYRLSALGRIIRARMR